MTLHDSRCLFFLGLWLLAATHVAPQEKANANGSWMTYPTRQQTTTNKQQQTTTTTKNQQTTTNRGAHHIEPNLAWIATATAHVAVVKAGSNGPAERGSRNPVINPITSS